MTKQMKPLFSVPRNVDVFAQREKYRLAVGAGSVRLLSHPFRLGQLVFCICFLGASLFATASLTIRTPNYIVIAADSKSEFPDPECKILPVGRFFYTAHTFVGYRPSGYDLREIIAKLGVKQLSMSDTVALFRKAIDAPLKNAMLRFRKDEYEKFKATIKGDTALGVLFAGLQNGELTIVYLQFNMIDPEAEEIALHVVEWRCPKTDCITDGYGAVFVDASEGARFKIAFEKTIPRFYLGNAATLARNTEAFVQMFIDAKARDVGPPISVLVIDRDGIGKWSKPCVAQRKQGNKK
jgi:hypothetical protein